MSGMKAFHNVVAILTKQFKVDTEAIEELRIILEKQQNREVTVEEAEAVGRSLINLVETLANGRTIVAHKEDRNGG